MSFNFPEQFGMADRGYANYNQPTNTNQISFREKHVFVGRDKNGQAMFEVKEYISIKPDDIYADVVEFELTEAYMNSDRDFQNFYKKYYDLWIQKKEKAKDGFPVTECPCFFGGHVQALHEVGVYTVDEFLSLSDAHLEALGQDFLLLKEKVAIYQTLQKDVSVIETLTQKTKSLEAEVKYLKSTIEQIQAAVNQVNSVDELEKFKSASMGKIMDEYSAYLTAKIKKK